MAGFLRVETDFDTVADLLGDVAATIPALLVSVSARIEENIKGIILEVFHNAVNEAGSGFPALYADHLSEGILTLDARAFPAGDTLIVEVGDITTLGNYSDLEQGFHYHALMDVPKGDFAVSNALKVELPYNGQPLLNDYDKRLQFWESVVDGTEVEVALKGHAIYINTAGLYQETIQARVAMWSSQGVYPEWLLLEYGTETHPAISPTHFTELLQIRVQEFANQAILEIADDLAEVVNRMDVGINKGGRPYNPRTGKFVKYIK